MSDHRVTLLDTLFTFDRYHPAAEEEDDEGDHDDDHDRDDYVPPSPYDEEDFCLAVERIEREEEVGWAALADPDPSLNRERFIQTGPELLDPNQRTV